MWNSEYIDQSSIEITNQRIQYSLHAEGSGVMKAVSARLFSIASCCIQCSSNRAPILEIVGGRTTTAAGFPAKGRFANASI